MNASTLAECGWGSTIDEALNSEFFSFFHLRIASTENAESSRILTYRPASSQFRERVAVVITVDEEGLFRKAQLLLSRAVIDDPRTEPMARDIVNSFLGAAAPSGDVPKLMDWMRDIRQRSSSHLRRTSIREKPPAEVAAALKSQLDSGRAVVAWTGQDEALPVKETEAAPVFSGEERVCERRLSQASVLLENVESSGQIWFRVMVSPLG